MDIIRNLFRDMLEERLASDGARPDERGALEDFVRSQEIWSARYPVGPDVGLGNSRGGEIQPQPQLIRAAKPAPTRAPRLASTPAPRLAPTPVPRLAPTPRQRSEIGPGAIVTPPPNDLSNVQPDPTLPPSVDRLPTTAPISQMAATQAAPETERPLPYDPRYIPEGMLKRLERQAELGIDDGLFDRKFNPQVFFENNGRPGIVFNNYIGPKNKKEAEQWLNFNMNRNKQHLRSAQVADNVGEIATGGGLTLLLSRKLRPWGALLDVLGGGALGVGYVARGAANRERDRALQSIAQIYENGDFTSDDLRELEPWVRENAPDGHNDPLYKTMYEPAPSW